MNCQERSGFLFAHPCDRLAAWTCATCQKQVCDAHVRNHQGQPQCITCMKTAGYPPTAPVAGGPYDDPYWYSHYHYRDYSYYDLDDYRSFRSPRRPTSTGSTGPFENDSTAT